jgi:hypothetical protein
MKKIILVAAVAMLVLASCKKDYTCECTSSLLGVTSFVIEDSSKSDAEDGCSGTGSTLTTCNLK